jgi:hypothetical protein
MKLMKIFKAKDVYTDFILKHLFADYPILEG